MEVMIKADVIKHRILLIRSQHVILDYDLSKLYGVPTKMLNKAVPRNIERFPADFMFQLSKAEHEILRCKIGTLGWGTYSKHLPRAFTEEGIAMLSGLLRSERAVRVNIAIMRAFVRLRRLVTEDRSLAALVTEHERRLDGHDQDIAVIETIPQLPSPAPTPEPRPVVGFIPPPPGKGRRSKRVSARIPNGGW